MKTHDVAKMLSSLAHALRNGPNQPLEQLGSRTKRRSPDPASIPMALSTLLALSDFDKAQWIKFIQEHGFPIDVRPRDASRDIIGKLLKFLEENPDARNRLNHAAQKGRSETSPELARALQLLLNT